MKKILKVEFKEFKELSQASEIITKYCNFLDIKVSEIVFVKIQFRFLSCSSYIFHAFIEYDQKLPEINLNELLKSLKDFK